MLINYEFIHRWVWLLFSTSIITLYCILGSECYPPLHYHTLLIVSRYVIIFFIECQSPLSCILVQYQSESRMFVILDCTNVMHTNHTFSHGFGDTYQTFTFYRSHYLSSVPLIYLRVYCPCFTYYYSHLIQDNANLHVI